uniref:Uncharacterized protein n=1 Tax=Cacopsylla melanoneura TaxID=428564 RepID=A0A8D8LE72_9HEMI
MEEIRSGAGRTYTSRATLELCTGGTGTVPSGSDDNMTSGACTSTDVDQSILFPLKSKCSPTQDDSDYQSQHITLPHSPLQLSTSLNSMRCILNSTPTPNEPSSNSATNAKKDRITQQTAEFLINSPQVSMLLSTREYHTLTPIPHALHLSEPLHAFSSSGYISSSGDKCKSGYDENGNALNQADRKKQRRHSKMKNEKNTYLAETVDGFRGNSKLSELLLFIENEPGNKNKKHKQQQQQQLENKLSGT